MTQLTSSTETFDWPLRTTLPNLKKTDKCLAAGCSIGAKTDAGETHGGPIQQNFNYNYL